jgi:hypothetical protein
MSGWYFHCAIWKHMGLQVTEKPYKHIPESGINTMSSTTVMWDVPVITAGRILANRPDIVLHDKKDDLPTDRFSHTR